MIGGQVAAIVWAQFRSLVNYSSRDRGRRFPFALLFATVWYALWAFGAYGLYSVAADPDNIELLRRALPVSLLAVFLYWQLIPIMMASTGLSLDLSRLLVYPIPHAQLFGIEVVLRITTSIEMLFVVGGLALGLAVNPDVPLVGLIALVAFTVLNLLVAAGLRDLFTRLMAKRGFREAMVLLIVLAAGAPQLLLTQGHSSERWRAVIENGLGNYWPWSCTARIAIGDIDWLAVLSLCGWTALAYFFSRHQFERSLITDAAESRAPAHSTRRRTNILDVLLRLPSLVFPDPLAALIEKEVRSMSRSPRFRLLFMMGFSFGLLIWLPLALRGDAGSPVRTNYLTIVSAYALMLMGEVCFWNTFGMDRTAAQTYFVMPLSFRTVLIAKNLAALFFIFVEVALVAACCALLRMPVSRTDILEAFCVTAVLALFMLSMGNMLSTSYPRPVDPSSSWRSGSAGRIQAFLLFIYPVASIPILLAYGARYAFETSLAFYAVLGVDVLLGLMVYYVSLDSAVATASEQKEQFVSTLSTAQGPVGT